MNIEELVDAVLVECDRTAAIEADVERRHAGEGYDFVRCCVSDYRDLDQECTTLGGRPRVPEIPGLSERARSDFQEWVWQHEDELRAWRSSGSA